MWSNQLCLFMCSIQHRWLHKSYSWTFQEAKAAALTIAANSLLVFTCYLYPWSYVSAMDIDQLHKYCKLFFRSETVQEQEEEANVCWVLSVRHCAEQFLMDCLSYLVAFCDILMEGFLACQCMCFPLLYFLLISAFVFFLCLPAYLFISDFFPQLFFLFWHCFYCTILYHWLAFVITTMVFW